MTTRVERFGDDRRTTIVPDATELEVEDLVAEEQVVITLSHESYLKRVPIALYRRRVARGQTLAGMDRYETDFLEHVFVASTTDTLVFFTDQGQAYTLPVQDVPEAGPSSRGRALPQILALEGRARVAALIAVSEFAESRTLIFLTANGTVKRTTLDQYANIRAGGIAAIRIADGDRLLDVQLSEGGSDVVIVTRDGRAIRFPEHEVPLAGRVTQGVRGVQLRGDDAAIGMVLVRREATLCTVTEQAYAKRTPLAEYPVRKRGGLGTITLDVTDRTGPLIAAKELLPGDAVMLITVAGRATRIAADDVPVQARVTQGKRMLSLEPRDHVVEVARVAYAQRSVAAADGAAASDDGAADGGERSGRARTASRSRTSGPGDDQLDLID
ncbi:MAG: DNA gyrase C-terminal beta-propeller domain-containing protein [Longimicrobiales bacterium]